MPQFDTLTFIPQLVWLGLLFGLLYTLVLKIVIPRFEKIQDKRAAHLGALTGKAETLLEEAKTIERHVTDKVQDAEIQSRALSEKTLSDLEKKFMTHDMAQMAHFHHLFKEAETRISRETETALEKLQAALGPLEERLLGKLFEGSFYKAEKENADV